MDREKRHNFVEHGSRFVGAVFMANRTTKLECFKRKLFGLPPQQTGFVKQIKAGMLLFLFEHEERKLYGVFEATCDGAVNIVPNAYTSSGMLFPAQILFKRIWMCKPLSEDEFRDAIKENYFTHKKFNFGLSYEQVFKLIHLFSLKKIGIQQTRRLGIPNQMIKEFETSSEGNFNVTGEGRSVEFYSMDDGIDSERYSRLSGDKAKYMSYEEDISTKQASFVNTGQGSFCGQPYPHAIQKRSPYLMRSISHAGSIKGNFPAHFSRDHHGYHNFPESDIEIPSVPLGMHYPLRQEGTAFIRPPNFRSQLHPLQAGPSALNFHSDYQDSSFPVCNSSSVILPEDHPERTVFNNVSGTEGYDPSNPRFSSTKRGMTMIKGIDSLPPIQSSSNANFHCEPSRQEFDFSGEQRWNGSPSDYIPLSGNNCFDNSVEPSHFSAPKDGSCSYASESEEDIESEDLKPHLAKQYDERPSIVRSRLHSDIEQTRGSVFSRLTKAPEVRRQLVRAHKPVADQLVKTHKPAADLSSEQLLNILSQRRKQWNEMTEVPKRAMMNDGGKFECIADVEQDDVASIDHLEMSGDSATEVSSTKLVAEGSITKPPFVNFKRRSEVLKLGIENDTNNCAESGEVKELSGKCKKRKLVRPSLGEECQNVEGSSEEIVEVKTKTIGENKDEVNTENGKLSEDSVTDIGSKKADSGSIEATVGDILSKDAENNPSVNDVSLKKLEHNPAIGGSGSIEAEGDVSSRKADNGSGGMKNRKKEISNRNLQWFLMKSIADNAKASLAKNNKCVEIKAKNTSDEVSKNVLMRPACNIKCPDQEAGAVYKLNTASSDDESKIKSEEFLSLM